MTDGTVTVTLEAYFHEPIQVEVLSQAEVHSEKRYPTIGVVLADPIIRRQVTLRGRDTHTVYAFAESIIVSAQLSPQMRLRLIEKGTGIGEIMREDRVETYREISSIRRQKATLWADYLGVHNEADVLVRNYTIQFRGRAVIAIEEVFPEALYRTK